MKYKYLLWIFVFTLLVVNVSALTITDSNGITLSTSGVTTETRGMRIVTTGNCTTDNSCILTELSKVTGCTATKWYLRDTNYYGTNLTNGTFTGNTANVNYPVQTNHVYWIMFDNGGAAYDGIYNNAVYNITRTNINWTGVKYLASPSTDIAICIQNVTTSVTLAGVEFVSPTPSSNSFVTSLPINLSVGGNITNSSRTIYLYNSTGLYNVTYNSSSINFSSLPANIYYINASVNLTNGTVLRTLDTRIIYYNWGILNLSVTNHSGTTLSFSANLSGVVQSGSSPMLFNLTSGTPYTLIIDNSSYALNTSTFTATLGYNNLSIVLLPNNAINLSIFSAISQAKITQNMTVVVTLSNATTHHTTTGNILLKGLEVGNNEIKVYNENYTESRYSINISDRSYNVLNAYVLPTSSSQNVTLTFYDISGAIIENVYITQSILSNTSSILVMSGYSDISGKAYFSYDPNYYYLYNCTKTGYIGASFILNPPRDDNYDITLTPSATIIAYNPLNITGTSTFNNNTNIINYSYISSETNIGSYDFYTFIGQSVICHNTSTSTTWNGGCNVSGYVGTAFVTGYADNRPFYGTSYTISSPKLSDYISVTDSAVISGLLALIIIIAGATINIFVALVFGTLAVMIIFWTGIFSPLTQLMITITVVISIIIAFVIRRRY